MYIFIYNSLSQLPDIIVQEMISLLDACLLRGFYELQTGVILDWVGNKDQTLQVTQHLGVLIRSFQNIYSAFHRLGNVVRMGKNV